MLSKKELGLRVKKARDLKSKDIGHKYTQTMLADDIKVSRSYVGDIESGRVYPSYEVLSKIKDICSLSLGFFDDTDIENMDEDEYKIKYNNGLLVYELLISLQKRGKLKDLNNIDKNTLDMLTNALIEDIKTINENEKDI